MDDVKASLNDCMSLFHALGDAARQNIILLLAEHDRLHVSRLAELMPLSRPAISHHLKVLKDAGLVTVARESREHYYSLAWGEPIDRLRLLVEQAGSACA